jgi:hypothetical protein
MMQKIFVLDAQKYLFLQPRGHAWLAHEKENTIINRLEHEEKLHKPKP